MTGRTAPPKPNISERPPAWGPWEWRNHLTDPRAFARIAPDALADYPTRMGLRRACLNRVYSIQFFERASDWGTIDHLIIRRHDGGVLFPWADLQRIKDELCGPERTAVEVFPPQTQLIDGANCRPSGCCRQRSRCRQHLEGWQHAPS